MLTNWNFTTTFFIIAVLITLVADSVFAQIITGADEVADYDDISNDNDECQDKDAFVPRNYTRYEAAKYPFTESALQLYTHREIKCNGFLVEWQFISRTRVVYALHLGVFRLVKETSSATPQSYILVNSTHIKLSAIRDFQTSQWVSFLPTEPFPVQKGDILGIFYDSFKTPRKLLTIVNRGPNSKADKPNTYIFPFGLRELLIMPSSSKNSSHVSVNVDVSKSTTFEYREPALTALISNNPVSRRTSTPVTTTSSITTILPTTTITRITQGPDVISPTTPPFISTVPTSTTHGASLQPSEPDIFVEVTTSHPITGMMTNRECMYEEDEIVSPSGMFTYAGSERYPFLEAGLHIFQELKIDCKGYLVEWNFLAPQNHSIIYGLYLAVFRPDDTKMTSFRLINATYLRLVVLPRRKIGQWLAYQLPAERQMPVEEGDFLGFYYARFHTASKLLTIATANDNIDQGNYTTWVFDYDAKTLDSFNMNKKTLRAKDAVKTYRQAALTAKVNVRIKTATTTTTTTTSTTTTQKSTTTTTTTPVTTTVPEITTTGPKSTRPTTIASSSSTRSKPTTRPPKSTTTKRPIFTPTKKPTTVAVTASFAPTTTASQPNSTTTIFPTTSEPVQMRYLTIIDRGKSICSYYQATTTIHKFDTEDDCLDFVGDNRKECNDDQLNLGICVDSNANCKTFGGLVYTRHPSAQACYASVDSFFISCVHQNVRSGSPYCSPSVANSKGCYLNDAMCQHADSDDTAERADILRRLIGRKNRIKITNVNVFLNVVGKGKTQCSYQPSATTIYKFPSLEQCELFAGDNSRMCEEEVAGLAICIDSQSECNLLMLRTAEIFLTSEKCHEAVDSFYNSCLHRDPESGELFCSPVMYHSEECYINNEACEFGKLSWMKRLSERNRNHKYGIKKLSEPAPTVPQKRQTAYLNLLSRGITVCEPRSNNATLTTFPDYASCDHYRGDNTKLCGHLNGDFGACIDKKSDCALIGGFAYEIHKTNEECFKEVDTYYTSCIQVDSDGKWFCSTLIRDSISCYQDDSTCQMAFEWSRAATKMVTTGDNNNNNNNIKQSQQQQQQPVRSKTASTNLSFLAAFLRRNKM